MTKLTFIMVIILIGTIIINSHLESIDIPTASSPVNLKLEPSKATSSISTPTKATSPIKAKPLTTHSIIKAINDYRGVSFKENKTLNRIAQIRADDMASRGYFAHEEPNSTEHASKVLLEKEGVEYSYVGENLARNFTNIKDLMRAWIDSPTHNNNMLLNTRTDIGVGINGNIIVVLFLGGEITN